LKAYAEFLNEAKNSPKLLMDMAAMERYLAESYGDRILIELLQNADDAMSTVTTLIIKDDTVFFANNGRSFNENDLISICRSGSSQKKRGVEIGYRGVGFKSTTSMTNDIVIYSDKTYFTFSRSRCASQLNVKETEVPTVRIPFLVEESELKQATLDIINDLSIRGYNSVFIFFKAKISIIYDEIKEFDASSLLFLKNINELIIIGNKNEIFSLNRANDRYGIKFELNTDNKKEYWWSPNVNGNINFVFKMNENEEIIECENNEAVFHCYLPI
jgi:hypothetical protein